MDPANSFGALQPCGCPAGAVEHLCASLALEVQLDELPANDEASKVIALDLFSMPITPCPGCGTGYLTASANPMSPHSFEACAAYRRGFDAGYAAALAAK